MTYESKTIQLSRRPWRGPSERTKKNSDDSLTLLPTTVLRGDNQNKSDTRMLCHLVRKCTNGAMKTRGTAKFPPIFTCEQKGNWSSMDHARRGVRETSQVQSNWQVWRQLAIKNMGPLPFATLCKGTNWVPSQRVCEWGFVWKATVTEPFVGSKSIYQLHSPL